MININKLSEEKDIGKWVWFTNETGNKKKGRIKNWGKLFIEVVYNCDNKWEDFKNYTAVATSPEDLKFIKKGE